MRGESYVGIGFRLYVPRVCLEARALQYLFDCRMLLQGL